jgi:hypothetical protein
VRPKELALDDAGEREGRGYANDYADGDEQEDFAHDEPDDVAAGGTETASKDAGATKRTARTGEAKFSRRWPSLLGECRSLPFFAGRKRRRGQ